MMGAMETNFNLAHFGCYGLNSYFQIIFFCKMVFACGSVEFSVELVDLEPTGLFRVLCHFDKPMVDMPFPTL